jgi:hypothetical protein
MREAAAYLHLKTAVERQPQIGLHAMTIGPVMLSKHFGGRKSAELSNVSAPSSTTPYLVKGACFESLVTFAVTGPLGPLMEDMNA